MAEKQFLSVMSNHLINGLHHVTAIAGSVKNNVRFYTEILGLRFVKKTLITIAPTHGTFIMVIKQVVLDLY